MTAFSRPFRFPWIFPGPSPARPPVLFASAGVTSIAPSGTPVHLQSAGSRSARQRLPSGGLRRLRVTPISLAALAVVLVLLTACAAPGSSVPLDQADVERLKSELSDRSFRQFDPHRDGDPRKAVVLDLFGPFTLWAQYAEAGHAVAEWEVIADNYLLEGAPDGSQVTLRFVSPRTSRTFPAPCRDCIETSGVSISIRHVSDPGRIAFRINDPNGVLPSPFPVFQNWTTFQEDEIQH